MKKSSLLFILWGLLNGVIANAQSQTLNAEQVLQIVRKYHPLVQSASIEITKSKNDILMARGAFDPILSNYVGAKTFNGINYYNDISTEIQVPTWYGIDLYGGYENLNGTRIDESQTTGNTSYLGVNIPLAKNLVLDKRRAFLQQAKIMNQLSVIEQQVLINDISMDAMDAYWSWVREYELLQIVSNVVTINEKRLELVIKSYNLGERPAIDTVEARSQLLSFQYMKNEKELAFLNAGIWLSAYLWKENAIPYQLPSTVVPEKNWEQSDTKLIVALNDLLSTAEKNHPELRVYESKLSILDIDKKLKFQELLPKVDFRYNLLSKGYFINNTLGQPAGLENNYQYGLKFEMPLRLSYGRASYQNAKLKIQQTQLDQAQKRQAIEFKIKRYFNEYITLNNQVNLQSTNYINYQTLVKAEESRFANGESSLFLINSRENKALEALEKLIEIKTKYYKSLYAMQWSAGLFQ